VNSLFKVENLKLHYRKTDGVNVHAIDGVSFELNKGEVLGILAESGSGLSTLAQGCTGLFREPLAYTSGDIRLDGKSLVDMEMSALRKQVLAARISWVPQNASEVLSPAHTVRDFARVILAAHYRDMSKAEILERITERFDRLELAPSTILGYKPASLSPVMRVKAAIAISTLMNPKVLIADDPTRGLQVNEHAAILTLVQQLLEHEIIGSVLYLSQNLSLLKNLAQRICVLYAGELIEQGTAQQITQDPRHPYSQALITAHIPYLPGPIPSLENPPEGCRFAPRCPLARYDCQHSRQMIRTIADRDVRCMYAR